MYASDIGPPGQALLRVAFANHHEPAASGMVLAHERQPGLGMLVSRHDDVLKQIAEARLDGPFVAAVGFEEIGDGALLSDAPVGFDEYHPGSVTELGSARRQFLERGQASFERRHFLLPGAYASTAPLEFTAGRGECSFRRGA
jgi:hypothetical protein